MSEDVSCALHDCVLGISPDTSYSGVKQKICRINSAGTVADLVLVDSAASVACVRRIGISALQLGTHR